ncbi:MAG: Cache 3/Cache 2 fusion domain-containing protein [Lacunisphaera sp.]|nr:Cache 3/Cache 2 fusion domain-containing protein [Lacunisphaera sp.]
MKILKVLSRLNVGTKIALLTIVPVLAALAAVLVTMLIQNRHLEENVRGVVRQQAFSEASKIANSVYLLCVGTESRNQKELTRNLGVARDLLTEAGGVRLADESVAWSAVNQITSQPAASSLPKVLLGSRWLGQSSAATEPSPVVDDVRRLTGSFCTIFQRMNEAGDMLRVGTSVLKTDGTRALGTYIPAKGADGADNTVIQSVLRGETYRGRAFVVNDWHAAAYEPIWDAAQARVIGMLYVGIPLATINRELQDAIIRMKVGKTGYVFVLGGQGTQRGHYLVSAGGKRDGENIWEAKDADGRPFIQSIITKGLATRDGSVDTEIYPWKNTGESVARTKLTAITSFPAWNWVIGAGAYEDDFADVRAHIASAQAALFRWIMIVAGAIAVLASVVGFIVARGITRPILDVTAKLDAGASQTASAANQVSSASQSLAEGASEQAASLEETSSSLEEMSSMTKRNAENASRANELTRQARTAADTGASDMQAMDSAMKDIKTSSDDIAKIIRTIDEIAFQTNILALNAAVEAARAGEAGAGFAVVAEEVRSLAQRSATAAKETAGKIEAAIGKAALGVEISGKVAARLGEIVDKVRQVDALIGEVATASGEQNDGVQQINTAVSQMDKVVQSNAGAAEESAAAAEELNAQAAILNEAVQDLQRIISGTGGPTDPEPAIVSPRLSAPAARKPAGAAPRVYRPASA